MQIYRSLELKPATNKTCDKQVKGVAGMDEKSQDSVQCWTSKRLMALVLGLLKGETSAQEAARRHGLTLAEIKDWRDKFLLGAKNVLRSRPRNEEALKDEQIKRLKQKGGELVLGNDILKEAAKGRPFDLGMSDE